jgi:glycosyltransferase involved in cell wall biosynthesis
MNFVEDLITLAIPVYNVEKYVERALLSALNQTYENIECLIVDDKGPINSPEIIDNIVSTHPRGRAMRIIRHPANIGVGAARNTAITHAKGKYICFMDSDDELTPDCIQKLHDEMKRTPVDMVYGGICHLRNGVKVISFEPENRTVRDAKEIIHHCFSYADFPVTMWNKLYNVSFLRANNIKCIHQILEEHYFTAMVLLHAQSYSTISSVTYLRHLRDDSAGGGGEWPEKLFEEWPSVLRDLQDLLQKPSLDDKSKSELKENLFKLTWYYALRAMSSPHPVQYYVNEYLNQLSLSAAAIFRSPLLFFAYIISIMPPWGKKAVLRLRLYMKRMAK